MKTKRQAITRCIPCIVARVMTLTCLLAVKSLSWGQGSGEGVWTQIADMPTARRYMTTSVIDGKIYAIGGLGGLNKTEVYDPGTDTWTQLADMPTPRVFASAGVVNGKIYVLGGAITLHGTPYTKVEEYDPETDTWTLMPDMPFRGYFFCSCTVDGKIYIAGGYPSGGRPGEAPLASAYEFDPALQTWTKLADLPVARALGMAGAVDGTVHVLGGLTAAWPAVGTVDRYHAASDEWVRQASIPSPRAGAGAGVLGDKIYVFGGIGGHGYVSESSLYMFDSASNTWSTLEAMPFRRSGMGTAVVDGSFYIIGGTAVSYPYEPSLATVWKYTPAPEINDPDGDGIETEVELAHGLDPYFADADSDYDGDGVIARIEIERGTMANDPDSDDDGLSDGVETNTGQFLSASDTGTDPTSADTDGDGQNDGAEVAGGSDPLDPESFVGSWPDLIPLNIAGFEPEGIALGNGSEFFVGAFSYSTWFGQPFSAQSGAIFKGDLRTGEGALLVPPTGAPVKGLSHDSRTDFLWVAKGMAEGTHGVIVYNAASGEELANLTFEGDRTNNDILVTENAVYCTDSHKPTLYRIPLESGGLLPAAPVVEDVPMTGFAMDPDPTHFNANGLVGAPDGILIVINTSTGVLYHVDTTTGAATPIEISGDEKLFVNGDGLHLDGTILYICQNFSNKVATVQLSDGFTSGEFLWNLVSENLAVPTTITSYGESIYAINTNFPQIATGNHAESNPAVVKLPNVGIPPLRISGFAIEDGAFRRIRFSTPAPPSLFQCLLDEAADPAGPWEELSAEPQGAGIERYFLVPHDPARKEAFYRVRLKMR